MERMQSAQQILGTPVGEPGETPIPGPGDGLSREVRVVAGVVVLGVVMSVLDTTIVNVALDTLSRKLHSPLSTIQPSASIRSRSPRMPLPALSAPPTPSSRTSIIR
jgi:hypothetical protein